MTSMKGAGVAAALMLAVAGVATAASPPTPREKALTRQVTALTKQVKTLKADKTRLQRKITTLTDAKTRLEGAIANLGTQVQTLTADKTTLEGQVATLGADKTALQGQVATLTDTNKAQATTIGTLQGLVVNSVETVANAWKSDSNPKTDVSYYASDNYWSYSFTYCGFCS